MDNIFHIALFYQSLLQSHVEKGSDSTNLFNSYILKRTYN